MCTHKNSLNTCPDRSVHTRHILPALLTCASLFAASGLKAATLAHYEFDGNFVNNVDMTSASTSGFTTPTFSTGAPFLGQGVLFEGPQGHEVWKNIAGSGLAFSSLSVAFWVKTTESNWRVPLTLEADNAQSHRMAIQISNTGHLYLSNADGMPGATGIWTGGNSDAYVSDGNWHHVAWTASQADNSSVLYVNGTVVGNNTWGGSAVVRLWMLGKLKGSVVNNYNGMIDDFHIFNHALTQQEVLDLIPVIPEPGTLSLLLLLLPFLARSVWQKRDRTGAVRETL